MSENSASYSTNLKRSGAICWKKIDRLEKQHADATRLKQQLSKQKEEQSIELTEYQDAQAILQTIAQDIQQQVHRQIADVVSRCLSAVFDHPYQFEIRFEQRRGKTEAELVLLRDGLELGNPVDAAGGGVIDVAAFALRLACLLLRRPPVRRMLVLDEPFKHVSENYRLAIPKMLQMLSDEFDLQVIMITHIEDIAIGKILQA